MKVQLWLTVPAAIIGAAVSVLALLYVGVILLLAFDPFGGDDHLKHEFAADDPAAVIAVGFDTGELHARLDASGHAHGVLRMQGLPHGAIDLLLDNDCQLARIKAADVQLIRVLGLDPSDECAESASKESMLALVRDELVPRLEGTLPPLAFEDRSGKEFYAYPDEEIPSLVMPGTLRDLAIRLDGLAFFDHEVHDGVYYLGGLACFGRFRAVAEPDGEHVRVVGIGYKRPCFAGDDQEDLGRVFASFLGADEVLMGNAVAYPTCVAPDPTGTATVVSPPSVKSLVPTCVPMELTPVP